MSIEQCAMRVSKSITDELGEREYASGLTKGPAAGVSERRQKTLDSHAMRNPLAFSLTSHIGFDTLFLTLG